MRVLFLSAWFPYPPDNGSRIRVFNLLRELARCHEVWLFTLTNHESDWAYVDRLRGWLGRVEVVPGRSFRPRSLRALRGFFSPLPRWLVDVHVAEMQWLVEDTVRRGEVDLVVASQRVMAPYLLGWDGVPKVLEELETTLVFEGVDRADGWWERWRRRLQVWKFSRFVRRLLLGVVDGCTVVSEPERRRVWEVVPGYDRVEVVPNGVDVGYYAGDFGPREGDAVVFTGVLSYFANLDALRWFLEAIWPLVRARRPGVRLYVTGRTEGVGLDWVPRDAGVVFTGYLPDVRPRVARSAVCVVPLRLGGGTRLKILEAMALGTPVVSTAKGAEGLEVVPGRDLWVADDPEGFAEGVVRLLEDGEMARTMAERARRLVCSRYDWRAIGARLNAFLEGVVEGVRC